MNLCPESEYRSNLSDEEFWDYIFNWDKRWPNWRQNSVYDYDELDIDDTLPVDQPCPTCRSVGACAYDSEGRPMIHTVEDSEDG
jgi:hypothetical protein